MFSAFRGSQSIPQHLCFFSLNEPAIEQRNKSDYRLPGSLSWSRYATTGQSATYLATHFAVLTTAVSAVKAQIPRFSITSNFPNNRACTFARAVSQQVASHRRCAANHSNCVQPRERARDLLMHVLHDLPCAQLCQYLTQTSFPRGCIPSWRTLTSPLHSRQAFRTTCRHTREPPTCRRTTTAIDT